MLVGRSADKPLADPERLRDMPAAEPNLTALIARARTANPTLAANTADVTAARTRRTLADKAWYPDLTIGAGPVV
jgi:outer membrane protein, heavy metal efflux system